MRASSSMLKNLFLASVMVMIGHLASNMGKAQARNVDPPALEMALSDDILIEGLGFSRLIVKMDLDSALQSSTGQLRLGLLLEKNLCWSGLVTLIDGVSSFCKPAARVPRVDMLVRATIETNRDGEEGLVLRLVDNGPEQLVLFEDWIPRPGRIHEDEIMDSVNRMAKLITGEYGLLGSTIAFVLRQPGYSKVIVATTTHGQRLRLISKNQHINLLPRFSPDGNTIIYTTLGNFGSRLVLHDFKTGQAQLLKFPVIPGMGSLSTGGAFSPDGGSIIITMSINRDMGLFSLNFNELQRNREHYKPRQLTRRLGIETQGDWSPDGKQLVFVSDRSGSTQIYLYELETGEDLRLTFEGNYNADPKWSPVGQHILFTRRVEGKDRIFIMDPFGENVRPVTGGRYNSEQPEWSPDGNQIVFSSNRTGVYKLYMVSIDGRDLRRLTNTPAKIEESSPNWTRRQLIR